MQNQQIFTKVLQLEQELKKIKAQAQKKPSRNVAASIWKKLDLIESKIKTVKAAVFDFDIEKFVKKQDVISWK